jgi:hypothetical protein
MLREAARKGASISIVLLSVALLVLVLEVAMYMDQRSRLARCALDGTQPPSRSSYALLVVAVPLWMVGRTIQVWTPWGADVLLGVATVIGVFGAALEHGWSKLSRAALACILVGFAVAQFAHLGR